jgi:nucleoside-diphosphate-sugar epimerase
MSSTVVFITGATGYIGGTVLAQTVTEFEALNVPVTFRVLVRNQAKAEEVKSWAASRDLTNIEIVIGDLDSLETIEKESANAKFVINTADCDHLESAKAITKGLTTSIEKGKHPILIHTSGTANIFQDVRGEHVGDLIYHDNNDSEINSIPDSNPHRDVDVHIRDFHKSNEGKIDVIIIAPSTIWGLGSGPSNIVSLQIPTLIRLALKYKQAYYFGKGIATWTEINVLDLAALYTLLLRKTIEEPNKHSGFYFGSNEEYQWKEAVQAIQDGLLAAGFTTKPYAQSPAPEEAKQVFSGSYNWTLGVASASRARAVKGPELGWERPLSSKSKFLLDIVQEVQYLAKHS